MSVDLRDALLAAAPKPLIPPDVAAITRRARFLTRSRRIGLLAIVGLVGLGSFGIVQAIPGLTSFDDSLDRPAGFGVLPDPPGSGDGDKGRYWMEFPAGPGNSGALLMKTDVEAGWVCLWVRFSDAGGIYEQGADESAVVIFPSDSEFEPGSAQIDETISGDSDAWCTLADPDRIQEIYDHPRRYEVRLQLTEPEMNTKTTLRPVPQP